MSDAIDLLREKFGGGKPYVPPDKGVYTVSVDPADAPPKETSKQRKKRELKEMLEYVDKREEAMRKRQEERLKDLPF